MRHAVGSAWLHAQAARQRRQTQAVKLSCAQQPRAQKIIVSRLRNEWQPGRLRRRGAHANDRVPMTYCTKFGVRHSFFVRIAASAAQDSSSLTRPVMPLVALMIALTMALLPEIRDAWRSGNSRSNPARKPQKSSFSCQRGSSKPGKRLATWASVCIAANASRVTSTTIAYLSWLDKNVSRFNASLQRRVSAWRSERAKELILGRLRKAKVEMIET